eukprot:9054347-Pyramimonas_sp.AAC.1
MSLLERSTQTDATNTPKPSTWCGSSESRAHEEGSAEQLAASALGRWWPSEARSCMLQSAM